MSHSFFLIQSTFCATRFRHFLAFLPWGKRLKTSLHRNNCQACPLFHNVSHWLLQFTTIWCQWISHSHTTTYSKQRCMPCTQEEKDRSHLPSSGTTQLAFCIKTHTLQTSHNLLQVFQQPSPLITWPAYSIFTNPRGEAHSPLCLSSHSPHSTHKAQYLWPTRLFCLGSSHLERTPTLSPPAAHFLLL